MRISIGLKLMALVGIGRLILKQHNYDNRPADRYVEGIGRPTIKLLRYSVSDANYYRLNLKHGEQHV